jgi:hypothetical protein
MSVIINGTSGISTDGGSELFGSGSIGGSLTLTSGTANGVTYLNGSKVLTSGSALTFNGSALTLAGDLTVNNAGNTDSMLRVAESVGTVYFGGNGNGKANIYFSSPSASAPTYSFFGDANTGMFWPAADTVGWSVGGSEQMRLTSTGLGIGTSSPAAKLHVVNTAYIKGSASTDGDKGITIGSGSGAVNTSSHAIRTGGGLGNLLIIETETANSSGQIVFNTNSAERMRLDSSGNLGLGVTPSAWGTAFRRAMQIGSSASFTGVSSGPSDYMAMLGNAFLDSGPTYRYISSATAVRYEASASEHRWYTAPSGTAGNAISFNQEMTLTAAGNLGIGTTSPADVKLSIFSGGAGTAGQLKLGYDNSNMFQIGRLDPVGTGSGNFQIKPNGGTSVFDITSSGSVGIGTSSPSEKLTVNGSINLPTINTWVRGAGHDVLQVDATRTYFYGGTNGVQFRTADNVSALVDITNAGNLLVGTTSSSISNTAGSRFIDSGRTLNIVNTGAVYPSIITNQVGYGGKTISFRYTDSEKGYIETTSTNVIYSTTSDYRLKNTIAPMTGALDKVALLKPVTYKWNEDGSDGQGFIAHELAEVMPDCVTGTKDAVDENGNPKYQGIDTSFLVATLTAALQEALARIESLEADVATLKGAA